MHDLNRNMQLLDKIFLLDNIVSVVDLGYGNQHKKVGVNHVHAHLSQVANERERLHSLLLNDDPNLVLAPLNLIHVLKQVQSLVQQLLKRSRYLLVQILVTNDAVEKGDL